MDPLVDLESFTTPQGCIWENGDIYACDCRGDGCACQDDWHCCACNDLVPAFAEFWEDCEIGVQICHRCAIAVYMGDLIISYDGEISVPA